MKVLMIAPLQPEIGGVSKYSQRLTSSLKNQVSLDVIGVGISRGTTFNLSRKTARRSPLQLFREFAGIFSARRDAARVAELVRKKDIDIVHVQYEPGLYNLFFTPFLMGKCRAKRVLTLHGRDYFPLGLFHRLFLYPRTDVIVVHNETHARTLHEKNVRIIPMGMESFEKTGFIPNLLYFGFMSPHKGIEFLLEAFSVLKKNHGNLKLYLDSTVNVAHEPEAAYRKSLETEAKKLGVAGSVVWEKMSASALGKVPASIAVFPFKRSYSAGQSMSVLDCMAAGKVPIVSNLPGLTATVRDGWNGLVVEPEDVSSLTAALERLLSDKGLAARLTANCRELTADNSWPKVAMKTAALYSSMLR